MSTRIAVFLLTIPLLQPSSVATADVLTLVLQLASGGSAEDLQGEIEIQPASHVAETPAEPARRVLTVPGRVEMHVSPGSFWRVTPRAPGFWSPEVIAAPGETVLTLFPTAEIRGEVRVPRGEPQTGALEVRFEPPKRRVGTRWVTAPGPAGLVTCPFTAGEIWTCSVPVGRFDLHLHQSGYASLHRWDEEIPETGTLDLGELELAPGASLVGRVEGPRGSPMAQPVRLSIRPLTGREPGGQAERRLADLARETQADERGFFQVQDLRPGTYRVEASAEGLATAVRQPVDVHERRETDLGAPLRLAPPVSLEILVTPPYAPTGARWRLDVTPRDQTAGAAGRPLEDLPSEDGRWTLQGLSPGEFHLAVRAGPDSTWWQGDWAVAEGTGPLLIDLPVVEIRGWVHSGDSPLAARLLFGGRKGRQRIAILSDEDGRLNGWLPREGVWPVAWQRNEGGPSYSLGPLDVEDGGDGIAWVDVELPRNRLVGRVVQEDGQGVADVLVQATRLDDGRFAVSETRTSRRLGEKGSFAFFALADGKYSLQIIGGQLSAPGKVVDVAAEGTTGPVELVVDEPLWIEGRVISARGPVAGAVVYLHPETLQPRRITVRRTLTGPEGRFETLVPQATRTAALVVLAPGFAARILRVVVDPKAPLQIPVGPHGGTLVLDLTAAGRTEPPAPPDAAVLGHAGAPGWVGVLEQWAEFHGQPTPSAGRWVLPMMEIGPYRLCTAGGESCDEGALQPGGELVLTLPESQPVEEDPARGVDLTAGGE